MMYRIARGGQVFGPYTEAEVRQYLHSGNVLLTDLVQPDGTADWALVGAMFAGYVAQNPGIGGTGPYGPRTYPDPPDLPWWAALLLGVATGGVFFVIWDLVEASWLRRIDRRSAALMLYTAVAAVYVLKLPGLWDTVRFNAFNGPLVQTHWPGLGLAGLILIVIARFVFRRELLHHFNGPEPLGLRLNAFWTLVLGGLYFQYKFNRINRVKHGTLGVGRA